MSRIGIGIKVVEVLGDTYYITKPILEKLIKKYGGKVIWRILPNIMTGYMN